MLYRNFAEQCIGSLSWRLTKSRILVPKQPKIVCKCVLDGSSLNWVPNEPMFHYFCNRKAIFVRRQLNLT